MNFVIKLAVAPGDENLAYAEVKSMDAKGYQTGKTIILEGEKFQEGIVLPVGGQIIIQEVERMVVYNPDTMAAEYRTLPDISEPFVERTFELSKGPDNEKADVKAEREKKERKVFEREEEYRKNEWERTHGGHMASGESYKEGVFQLSPAPAGETDDQRKAREKKEREAFDKAEHARREEWNKQQAAKAKAQPPINKGPAHPDIKPAVATHT